MGLIETAGSPKYRSLDTKSRLFCDRNGATTQKGESMKLVMTAMRIAVVAVATAIVAGCGSGNGSSPAAKAAAVTAATDGASLYSEKCAGCHGALATSSKAGVTLARVQTAISTDIGGMGALSSLTSTQLDAIVTALNSSSIPPPLLLGADLYAASCAGCHGALASSTKGGATTARIQAGISNPASGMGIFTALSVTQIDSLASALAGVAPPPPPPLLGAELYAASCAGCHGPLASSTKGGASATRIQAGISNPATGMSSLSALSTAQINSLVTALAGVAPPPPPPLLGAELYAASCAGCHGPLASSAKGGATAARIQAGISNPATGMGSLSALSAAQVNSLVTALSSVVPTPAACGSCHAIPPATGRHAKHKNEGVTCDKCHGSGYSTTTFNAATHNNGVKNVVSSIGWNSTSRNCTQACHGTKSW
jgi:mono/diheme cytochrome c family protein